MFFILVYESGGFYVALLCPTISISVRHILYWLYGEPLLVQMWPNSWSQEVLLQALWSRDRDQGISQPNGWLFNLGI